MNLKFSRKGAELAKDAKNGAQLVIRASSSFFFLEFDRKEKNEEIDQLADLS